MIDVTKRMRDLPLRVQLMLVFAVLSVVTTAVSTVTLTSLAERRMHNILLLKSNYYAHQLQQNLQFVLEPDSRLTARGLFDSLAGDQDVDGLGVYLADGEPIEGRGARPERLTPTAIEAVATRDHVIAVAPIHLRDRLAGRLYVSLTTAPIDALHRRDLWVAAGVASLVVLSALLAAVLLSRRMARRLGDIASAANRMATGEQTQALLEEDSHDEIGDLAHAFNVMVCELSRLSGEHERLVATERERLEVLVAERTQELERSREMFRLIAESTHATPFKLDLTSGAFPYVGAEGIERSGVPLERWQAPGALDALIPRHTNPEIRRRLDDCTAGRFEFEAALTGIDGARREMRWAGTCEATPDGKVLRGLMQDVTELRRLERELTAAQKLESVGRLAAGVAHEINTPLQFVTDNVQFARTSLEDIGRVLAAYRELKSTVDAGGPAAQAAAAAQAAEQAADLGYLLENTPMAIADAIEGLGRITTIVRSMKEFAYPDQGRKSFADLNHAIQSTLVIAHNEYKYVAELQTELADLPQVECYLGEFNQVILNLIVNASHAIGDVVGNSGTLGRITVRTRRIDGEVEISISDTGTGIPADARDKIFEPFFTTKEIGRGTGQGLALARSVIVNKHLGTLHFETEMGRGTTFYIRLPIHSTTESVALEPAAA